jgi:rare lipoprotein A
MMQVAAAHAPAQAGDPHEPKEVAQLAGTESQNMGAIKAPLDALMHVASTAVASANSVALVVGSAATAATNKVLDVADVIQHGIASWYGANFQNKRTANGERFNMNELTAAHRTLPFGTKVCAHLPSTGKSVIVRINDRGPVASDRIIDFSKAAAQALGILHSGPDAVALLDSSDKHCSKR